jgi:alpha-tubulin suppressor-like RCC1 family protein
MTGNLWAWGHNTDGRLGDGTNVAKHVPTNIGSSEIWLAVSGGAFHTIALGSNGTLWAWGANGYGQLGDGTNVGKHVPTQIGSDTDWSAVSAGGSHSHALKSDGTLWGWGYNQGNYQLGEGTTDEKNIPTQIGSDTDWSNICAGGAHSAALKTDGTLWGWGSNLIGQLGDGNKDRKAIPTQVGLDTDWAACSLGRDFSVALKFDGTIWSWGWNGEGQLEHGYQGGVKIYDRNPIPTQIGLSSPRGGAM